MKKIASKHLLIFLFLTAISALSVAYISQYYFGIQPCQLCFWQRYPFFAIIILTSLFLANPFLKKYQNSAVKIGILLLIINAGIAFYHSGVERKFFKGLDSCSSISTMPDNIDDLHKMLLSTKAVPCDQPQFIFLTLSMAEWNLIYCLILIFTVIRFLRKENNA
jgi:disulfide bond formation protein DsbB